MRGLVHQAYAVDLTQECCSCVAVHMHGFRVGIACAPSPPRRKGEEREARAGWGFTNVPYAVETGEGARPLPVSPSPMAIPNGKPFHLHCLEYGSDSEFLGDLLPDWSVPRVWRSFWNDLILNGAEARVIALIPNGARTLLL